MLLLLGPVYSLFGLQGVEHVEPVLQKKRDKELKTRFRLCFREMLHKQNSIADSFIPLSMTVHFILNILTLLSVSEKVSNIVQMLFPSCVVSQIV